MPFDRYGALNMENSLLSGHSSDWWNSAMLLSLALAAFVALLVAGATTGAVMSARREAAAAQRDLERYKSTVAGQVADAKKAGIEAGEKAGNADLKAAQANERAAAFEKEAQELKESNLALEVQIQPRRLSGENSKKLAEVLSKMGSLPIGIVSRIFDPEGSDFADDLGSAFGAGKWHPVRQRDWTMSNRGVAIATFEGTTLPPDFTNALISALAGAGIKATMITISKDNQNTTSAHFQPNELYLLVGAKP
jgi:hypothetical protein